MNVLVVGSGGREHALAWKAAQSALVDTVYVAPGNPGTQAEPKCENAALDVTDFEGLATFAQSNAVGLTIVGPEVPLVDGIRDVFDARGLACFAPTKAAAQLEGSKVFTKQFLARHNIPTAAYEAFTDIDKAAAYIRQRGAPIVVKANGLAAGKGVVVAATEAEAIAAAQRMLSGEGFGDAGREVVIEDCLVGEEASFIVVTDGVNIVPFASSQDHKARDEGDKGPNTGGLGAYSPAPVVTPVMHERIMEKVIRPTVGGMAEEGTPYQGFLYAGLMITDAGDPYVIEYNCRFGDPEAEPLMLRLKSDLVALCLQTLGDKGLEDVVALEFDERAALAVVMASGGYPGEYATGYVIQGMPSVESNDSASKIFHAGTTIRDDEVVTAGGRVLCVTALGSTVAEAQARAYAQVSDLSWSQVYYRRDIGYRAVEREQS